MTQPILTIKQLSFERQYKALLQNIECTVHAGETLQIRGANGSGKSTLLRILAGYIQPEAETVFWQNECITKQSSSYPQQLHYIGHQHGIKSNLSVLENLRLNSALMGKTLASQELSDILKKVGLHHQLNTLAQQLSAGQSRRLALARLLLQPLPLWLLDEPHSALDKTGQALLTQLLETHLQQGGIAIIATHQDLHFQTPMQTLTLGEQHA